MLVQVANAWHPPEVLQSGQRILQAYLTLFCSLGDDSSLFAESACANCEGVTCSPGFRQHEQIGDALRLIWHGLRVDCVGL